MPADVTTEYLLLATAIMFLVTFGLRSLVFLAFGGGRKPPQVILYIGGVISPAIITALIVYCFRNTTLLSRPHGLPELIAAATCILLHLWKRNPLISIIVSTIVYMILVQRVFC